MSTRVPTWPYLAAVAVGIVTGAVGETVAYFTLGLWWVLPTFVVAECAGWGVAFLAADRWVVRRERRWTR